MRVSKTSSALGKKFRRTGEGSFWGNLGDQVKGRSQKKLKSLIELPYVAHLKVQVLSFNKNLIFSP